MVGDQTSDCELAVRPVGRQIQSAVVIVLEHQHATAHVQTRQIGGFEVAGNLQAPQRTRVPQQLSHLLVRPQFDLIVAQCVGGCALLDIRFVVVTRRLTAAAVQAQRGGQTGMMTEVSARATYDQQRSQRTRIYVG
jgi:hypothetical protein